ncbi:unnamed protein product [Ilex paraguariensis]|uniref:Uncharacterized protein n=1 Tax=Ilex paraguariensis TaxID=185542 RepID=A0ABC8SZR3_9AQUA
MSMESSITDDTSVFVIGNPQGPQVDTPLQFSTLPGSSSTVLQWVTIFTTPANHPFVSQSLLESDVSIIGLPFPENIAGIPSAGTSNQQQILAFHGCVPRCLCNRGYSEPELNDEPFALISFPLIKLNLRQEAPFNERIPKSPFIDLLAGQEIATSNSYGLILNSFYELEGVYLAYWNH